MPTFKKERNKTIPLSGDDLKEKVVLENCTNCKIEGETFTFNKKGNVLTLLDCNDCKIIDCTFKDKDTTGDMLSLEDCENCKVTGCTFQNKKAKGNFIHVRGANSKRNRIEGCTFRDHKFTGKNGGEAIIIGLDVYTGCRFKTFVRECKFINCSGDPEMVSIKSCDNELEGNTIKDSTRGNFTIRNGGFNKIIENTFIGSGGIRVLGDGNEITGNTHKNNDNKKFPPLSIENGNIENDENFRNGKPIDRKGKGTDLYARAKNNTIEDNTYENCKGVCVVWGKANRPDKPRGNKFRKNTLIANSVDSTFLEFDNKAEEDKNKNTFEDNKMNGSRAKRGDLPEGAIA